MTAAEGRRREGWGERLARAFAVFLDPRVLIILLLGFSSGLPLALSASTLLLWMKDVGVDLKTIGLFALVGVPYTIKFLWAPIVDAFQVPILSKALGHRRGWLVFTQLLLIASILFLGFQDPVRAPLMVALAALLVATASATQDIVIERQLVWTYGYAAMAALVLIGMAAAFMAKEPRAKEREAEAEALGERTGNPLNRFFRAAYDAFADFLSK